MSAWKDFVTASLIGTESGQETPALPAVLAEMLAPAGALSGEAKFLTRAGALAWWRRGGYQPSRHDDPTPALCPPETASLVSETSAGHLRMMLGGHQTETLPEWLGEAARQGRCAPPELLPPLLERARQNRALRPLVLAAGGTRTGWLATCNPEWNFAADAGPEHWETGSASQRFQLLLGWRSTDPAHAREKLAAIWKTESADGRANFLLLFREGLSDADTALLETALDDRSQHVRQIAVDLLSKLPDSPFVARMVARAGGLLNFKSGGFLSRKALDVTLPEPPDAAGLRDGLDPKSLGAQRTLGEKAGVLALILAAVPLARWTNTFQQPPAALLQAVKKNDFAQAVVTGWTLAALRQRDAAWAEALLETTAGQPAARELARTGDLLTILPEAVRTKQLASAIRGGALGRQEAWMDLQALLLTFQPYLPVPVAQDLMRAWRALAAKPLPWHLQSFQRTLALQIPPKLLPFALDDWPAPNHAAAFVEILSFRHETLAALAQS